MRAARGLMSNGSGVPISYAGLAFRFLGRQSEGMRFVLTALALLLSAASQAAERVLPDFIPPGTNLVLGFSLRGLADSELVKAYAGAAKIMSTDYLKGSPLAGLDPFKDIDDVIVAVAGEGEKAPALVVLRGRFNVEKLAAGAERYHDVPIFKDAKNAGGILALLDTSTAIAGDPAQVQAAIDRRGKGARPAEALVERVQALQSRFDIWGVGDVPKGIIPAGATAPELQAIDRFEFGASLRHGLELTGQIHARSSKDTEKMMASLQLLAAMMKLQAPPSTGAKFDLQSDQENVKLSIFIPEEELKKGIQAQQANFASSIKSEAKAEAPKPIVAPARSSLTPKPGVVKNERGDAVTLTLPGGR